MTEYKTAEKESFDEFIVKKSRFIGYIKPVRTNAQAVDFINEIRAKHRDATHNVYAYVLREDNLRRYSDDGEPQGTAGMPVLDVLLKQELTDVAVVATRYFGGIMLGAGGLVRAYSNTAKIACEAGNVITMALCTVAEVRCDYNFFGRLSPLIIEAGGVIEDTEYTDSVKVTFRIRKNALETLQKEIIDSSAGRFNAEPIFDKFLKI